VRNRTEKSNRINIKKLVRPLILLLMLVSAWTVLTAGIFSGAVRLKNVNEPFIDLDSTIADKAPGKGGNTETGIEDEGKDDASSSKEDTDTIVELRIEIREESIKVDDTDIQLDNFEAAFGTRYKEGVEVRLIDDYAEYHTYKTVKEILEGKGIKPVEEQK